MGPSKGSLGLDGLSENSLLIWSYGPSWWWSALGVGGITVLCVRPGVFCKAHLIIVDY